MYDTHALTIAQYARQSPDNLFNVGRFVLATVNRHFEDVPQVLRNLDRGDSRALTGKQKYAIGHLSDVREHLYELASRWTSADTHVPLRTLALLPGFGLVKAGFFVQLLVYDSPIGCLDRHNIRAYGLKPSAFSTKPKVGSAASTSRINQYISVCRGLGGAKVLWDRWCEYLAALRPKSFPSAEYVSALHVQCLNI